MSILYYIELETEYSLKECKNILLNGFEHETIPTKPSEITAHTEYFVVSLEKVENVEQSFSSQIGLKPTVTITIYRVRRSHENTMPSIFQMFMRWVHKLNDNAIFLYEGEKVILLWKNGKLIRNNDPMIWRDDVNEIIDKEYTLKSFPTL